MEFKQIFLVRADLKMGKWKIAAQCCHAAIEAYEKAKSKRPEWVEEWKSRGMAKVVLKADSENELLEYYSRLKKDFPASLIRDAGHTQLEPSTITCIAAGPAPSDLLDKITGKLKLL